MITFEDFYAQYPRKKSRADARKAWDQMIKKGVDPIEIIDGLRINLESLKRREPQFIPYPATWLRGEGWADEPDPIRVTERKRTLADAREDLGRYLGNADGPWNAARH